MFPFFYFAQSSPLVQWSEINHQSLLGVVTAIYSIETFQKVNKFLPTVKQTLYLVLLSPSIGPAVNGAATNFKIIATNKIVLEQFPIIEEFKLGATY